MVIGNPQLIVQDLMMELDYRTLHVHVEMCVCVCVCLGINVCLCVYLHTFFMHVHAIFYVFIVTFPYVLIISCCTDSLYE